MAIVQNSFVRLFSDVPEDKVPLGTYSAVMSYLSSKEVKSEWTHVNKFSYLRLGNPIKIGIPIDEMMGCNYISIRNPNFENIEYFAFITNLEYVNNKTTRVSYAIDPWTTGIWSATINSCKINREHISYDDKMKALKNPWDPTIYEHYTDEGLATGRMLEKYYGLDDITMVPEYDRDNELWISDDRCALLFIADFDTDEFPNINEQFYQMFDCVFASDGSLVFSRISGVDSSLDSVRIPRGYGLYLVDMDSSNGPERLKQAIKWMTIQGLEKQILYPYMVTLGQFILYIGMASMDISNRYIYNTKVRPYVYQTHTIDSEKLYLSPYSYVRVYNGEGSCKEYKWEKFNEMRLADSADSGYATFSYLPILDTFPMASMMPVEYEGTTKEVFNFEERMDSYDFPQISYTTDAFLAFISAQNTSNIASRSNTISEAINQKIDAGMVNMYQYAGTDEAGAVKAGFGAIGGAGRAAISPMVGLVKSAAGSQTKTGAAISIASSVGDIPLTDMRNEAAVWRSNPIYESNVLGPAKSAFVSDEYHAGTTNGILGEYLLTPRHAGSFKIVRVQLQEEVLRQYDRFFRMFGYKSERIGIPRVANVIDGYGDQPYFAPFDGQYVTYVKTSGANVEHNIEVIREGIKSMLDNGVLFFKV